MEKEVVKAETTFHERLIAEKDNLDEKINKLSGFLNTEPFGQLPIFQQSLLRIQFHAMNTYSQCLLERLGDLQ
jgi:hypothetical protein